VENGKKYICGVRCSIFFFYLYDPHYIFIRAISPSCGIFA
jgi:hypothetical protein